MSTCKGLTPIWPLSCGFDSSVGRALHQHRRGCGFESRSELGFFSGLCSSSVAAALALMTVVTQLLLWTKLISLLTKIMYTILSDCSVYIVAPKMIPSSAMMMEMIPISNQKWYRPHIIVTIFFKMNPKWDPSNAFRYSQQLPNTFKAFCFNGAHLLWVT